MKSEGIPVISRGQSVTNMAACGKNHLTRFTLNLDIGKERSNSLPGYPDAMPSDNSKHLREVLADESLIFAFTEHMKVPQKEAVNFFCDTKRFLEYAKCTDPLVANNMTQNICMTYQDKDGIPEPLREVLQQHLEGKFGDLDTNIQFIKDCSTEIFDFILLNIYPQFSEYTLSMPAPTPRQATTRRCASIIETNSLDDPFENFSEDSIQIVDTEKGKVIVAASIERIISLLTGDLCDHELTFTIILTLKYFMPEKGEFLELLHQRLIIFLRKQKNKKDPTVIKMILRMVNLLKTWVETHIQDFTGSNNLADKLRAFARQEVEPILPSAATNLINFLDTRSAAVLLEQPEEEFQFSEKPPRSKKSGLKGIKRVSDVELDDIHPLEFARQMALVDHALYRAIQPGEVLHMNWTKDATKHERAPNVLKMIEQFNRVGQWVISSIITTHDKPKRVKLLQHMIKIAYESYMLNNLNGAMAMISGLKNSNVIRLKDTWNELSSANWDLWEEITEKFVLNDNFSSLRKILKETQPPLIPYLGIYLSDFTFTDGQPTFIQDDLVNLAKLRGIAKVQQRMKEGQSTPYCLTPVPLIQEYITSLEFIPECDYLKHRKICETGTSASSSTRASRGSMQLNASNLESRKPKRTKSIFSGFKYK